MEEPAGSILRENRILKMETIGFSEMSVLYCHATYHHIAEDSKLDIHCCENLKFQAYVFLSRVHSHADLEILFSLFFYSFFLIK